MKAPGRRSVLLGLGSAVAAGTGLQACAPALQAGGGTVAAAGQPAALLVWAVAREQLAAWPRKPDSAARADRVLAIGPDWIEASPPAHALSPDRVRALFGVETPDCPCCGQALG